MYIYIILYIYNIVLYPHIYYETLHILHHTRDLRVTRFTRFAEKPDVAFPRLLWSADAMARNSSSLELKSQLLTNLHGLKMWSAVLRVQVVYTWDSMIQSLCRYKQIEACRRCAHNTMFWMNHVQDSTLFNESFRSFIIYSI